MPGLQSRLALYLDLMRWNRPPSWRLLLWPTLSALWMAADGWPGRHLLIVFTLRTKARNDTGFRCVIDLGTNSSNNTVNADAGGNIAYFQGNFIPVNDPRFDFTQPVDGSDPAAGANSLRREDYPAYL